MRLQTTLAAGLVAIAAATPVAVPDNAEKGSDVGPLYAPLAFYNPKAFVQKKKRDPQSPYGRLGFALDEDTKEKREPQQNYGGKKFFRD